MKIKLKYLVFIAYVALIISLFAVSLTMARYVSDVNTGGDFEIGEKLENIPNDRYDIKIENKIKVLVPKKNTNKLFLK